VGIPDVLECLAGLTGRVGSHREADAAAHAVVPLKRVRRRLRSLGCGVAKYDAVSVREDLATRASPQGFSFRRGPCKPTCPASTPLSRTARTHLAPKLRLDPAAANRDRVRPNRTEAFQQCRGQRDEGTDSRKQPRPEGHERIPSNEPAVGSVDVTRAPPECSASTTAVRESVR
jgi:hypothetical protein